MTSKADAAHDAPETWALHLRKHLEALEQGKNSITQEDIEAEASESVRNLLTVLKRLQVQSSSKNSLEAREADANRTMQLEKAYAALDESHQTLRNVQAQLIQAAGWLQLVNWEPVLLTS